MNLVWEFRIMIRFEFGHPVLVITEKLAHFRGEFRVIGAVSPLMNLRWGWFVISLHVFIAGIMFHCPFIKLFEISTFHNLSLAGRRIVLVAYIVQMLIRLELVLVSMKEFDTKKREYSTKTAKLTS